MINYNPAPMNRFNKDDKTSVEKLLRMYGSRIYNISHYLLGEKTLARVVVNQVIMKIHQTMENIPEDHCLDKWMYNLTIDSAVTLEKKMSSRTEKTCKDFNGMITSAIADLPINLRVVLILHDIQKLSYREISEILNLSVDMVAMNLHKGRLTLKETVHMNKR